MTAARSIVRRHAALLRASARLGVLALTSVLVAGCDADAASASGGADQGATATAATASAGPAAAPVKVVLRGVDVTGIGYDLGSAEARVVVVEFSDFGCGYCAKHALETFPLLQKEFIDAGTVFYKHVPFVMGMFPNSDMAAAASECAADQGEFWRMHDRVFEAQRQWKGGNASDGAALFLRVGRELGLDAQPFANCVVRTPHPRTRRADAAARQLGIRATPTFFINGEPIEGALPPDVFQRVLRNFIESTAAGG